VSIIHQVILVITIVAVAGLAFAIFAGGFETVQRRTLVPAGILVGVLTAFHLFVESRLRPVARSLRETADPGKTRFMVRFLRVVPRFGIAILTTGFVLIVVSVV